MKIKQVIVARKDLNMSEGKLAAQVAHASMGVFINMSSFDIQNNNLIIKISPEINRWFSGEFTKICVYVNSEQELLDIYDLANLRGLPCSIIKDSGHTEFSGVATYTTVGIGPADSKLINKVTGSLPLI